MSTLTKASNSLVVGVGDMKVSAGATDVLITYALGSCLGVTVYDPIARVAGLLHVMLPDSTTHGEKAVKNPYMFVDTGIPRLFKAAYELGARKDRMILRVAGGATRHVQAEDDHFKIGKNNFLALRKILWKNNVLIDAQEVGGTDSRTIWIDVNSGQTTLKVGGTERPL